jgi:hypothetical protein
MSVFDILDVLNGLWYVNITDGKSQLSSANIIWLKKKCQQWAEEADLTVTRLEYDDDELIITIKGATK